MPEFCVSRFKRPAKSILRYSRLHVFVLGDINIIIEIDNVLLIDLPINGKRSYCQNNINNQFLLCGIDVYFIYHNDLLRVFIPHVRPQVSRFLSIFI